MSSTLKIPASISQVINGFSHLWFPNLCKGCRTPLLGNENILCLSCESYLPRTKYHEIADNETSIRLSGRFPFIQASSYGYFSGESLLQYLVHELKYSDKKEIGIYLGKKFGIELKESGWKADAIVPVPLHKRKEAKRGYNQSLLIAEGMSEILGIPVLENALLRKRNTETQTDKTREQRVNNVSDAFAVNKNALEKYQQIILVDDVLTTGATIESCAKVLLEKKGLKLSIATIGIAVN